jgi:hypothetical protein
MAVVVTGTAMMMCSFGVAPSVLNVLPVNRVLVNTPVGTIMDNIPMLNIVPFGMCNSIANPVVIAATAAKLGVFTPMPCIPATVAPWIVGSPTVLTGNMPTLNSNCKLICMWGGVINITFPGQVSVMATG